MKYMGSKARVAKDISLIINKLIQEKNIHTYIEPFVGGANLIEHIQCENKMGYDNNEYLIEFWKQIQQGWNPLCDVDMSKENYDDIKNHMSRYPQHIVALAGFCATYNAKWFGGYAGTVETKDGTFRNYYDEAVRNVLKQSEHIKDVHFECLGYQQIEVEGALIYCDPPYQGTTRYKDEFDHEEYWAWVRKMSEKNIVLCSEYSAPPDFECVWSKELTTTLDKNSRSKAVEKLFVCKKETEAKKTLKVLSLFDGVSCGMVALERAGISVEKYVAYEIEPNAIKISKKNYPQIEHCGDVTTADFTQYQGFDLLIGGSPCQDLSIYKTSSEEGQQGLDGKKSNLFWHYVRALKECKPKYFLLENVTSMPQWCIDVISHELGVQPIAINSSLVCAAERNRLYWTNIPNVELPEDKGLILKDIVLSAEDVPAKYWLDKPFTYNGDDKKVQCTLHINNHRHAKEVYNLNGKCNTILCDGGGGLRQKKVYQNGRCRKLMPIEYERLQTLPDGYTEGVADSHRYTAIGNGWTVDVITHILSYIPKQEREEKEMELKVKTPTFPDVIEFNFEELKQEITKKASDYVNLVYTEEQIQDAKKDRAALNKFVKALSDERIKIKNECLKPYEDFETKIKELAGIVNQAIANIDGQVEGYEEKKREEKRDAIKKFWNETEIALPIPLTLEQIFDEKWLNASVSMKSIQTEINELLAKIEADLATLSNLPEFAFEAVEEYKTTLDLSKAIQEGQRLAEIQKRKQEAERLKAEQELAKHTNPPVAEFASPVVDEALEQKAFEKPQAKREWIGFKANLTTADAQALANLFAVRGIEYEQIAI